MSARTMDAVEQCPAECKKRQYFRSVLGNVTVLILLLCECAEGAAVQLSKQCYVALGKPEEIPVHQIYQKGQLREEATRSREQQNSTLMLLEDKQTTDKYVTDCFPQPSSRALTCRKVESQKLRRLPAGDDYSRIEVHSGSSPPARKRCYVVERPNHLDSVLSEQPTTLQFHHTRDPVSCVYDCGSGQGTGSTSQVLMTACSGFRHKTEGPLNNLKPKSFIYLARPRNTGSSHELPELIYPVQVSSTRGGVPAANAPHCLPSWTADSEQVISPERSAVQMHPRQEYSTQVHPPSGSIFKEQQVSLQEARDVSSTAPKTLFLSDAGNYEGAYSYQQNPGSTCCISSSRQSESPLQTEVDNYCVQRFAKLCRARAGDGLYCTSEPVVGRYGSGSAKDSVRWRCFVQSQMSLDTRSVGCVDRCGNLMRCVGAARHRTISAEAPELEFLIAERRGAYCSAYQQAADALCNFKTSGDLARFDPVRNRWLCLDLDDVALEAASYCVDNCGNPTPCAGGLIPGVVPKYTVHIVQPPDMERAFEAVQPCPGLTDICIATFQNPPRCVSRALTVAVQRLSARQAALDEECQLNMDAACREGAWKNDCYKLWLARWVRGAHQESKGWGCYPESLLDFTKLSRCTDNCGNLTVCRGAPSQSKVPPVKVAKVNEIAKESAYCSAAQSKANSYCQSKHGPGFAARQHCGTFKWQCVDVGKFAPRGWSGCIGHCGEFTWCPTEDTDESENPLTEDAALAKIIDQVPDACPTGEQCVPTILFPPYCSISSPLGGFKYRVWT